jgi:hypothetical protein
LRANNPSGIAHQRVSPLNKVEPLLCDLLCELARLGEAQTKYEIMELANDLIRKTVHAAEYISFCEKRNIRKKWKKGIVGERWYKNLMNRYKHKLKRSKHKVQDANRRTYCTYENFSNMYKAVYENMVDAGVAIKLREEVMFDMDGNITDDPNKMFGRPSKYKIIKPE